MGACCSADQRESLTQQFARFQQQQQQQQQKQNYQYQEGLAPIQQQPPQQKNQSLLFSAAQSQQSLSHLDPQQLQQLSQHFEMTQQYLTPQQQQQLFNQQQILISQQQQMQLQQQQQQFLQVQNNPSLPPLSIQPIHSKQSSFDMSSFAHSPQQMQFEEERQLLEKQKLELNEKEQLLVNLQQQLQMQQIQQQLLSATQVVANGRSTNVSSQQSPDQSMSGGAYFQQNLENKSFKIMERVGDIINSYEKFKQNNGGQIMSTQSDNQLLEEYKLFEGHYFQAEYEMKKDLKLFIKFDESTNTLSGTYHDRQIKYEVQGIIDPSQKQILIGLFKKPLLIIVGQYHPTTYLKIQGFTMDQDTIDDNREWHDTTLLLKNA